MNTLEPGFTLIITANRAIIGIDYHVAANREETRFAYCWPHTDKEIQRHIDFFKARGESRLIDERC